MMPEEKEQLLALLNRRHNWCTRVEAQDSNNNAVPYDDDNAVAWDITGALCRLFGWQRACTLFVQVDRHIHGKRSKFIWPVPDWEMDAMRALQEYNDRPDISFDTVRQKLESMPIWSGQLREHSLEETTVEENAEADERGLKQ
jgi:hypothetical protein